MAKGKELTLGEADDALADLTGEMLAEKQRCHDCGAQEGEFHKPGCDMERCPFCGGQLISCECAYKKLGIDVSPGTWAYKHGLTEEQGKKWDKMLRRKGLIPYSPTMMVCARCGRRDPEFFNVPDKEWEHYVPPELQKEVLCRPCYDHYKKIFPKGWRHGRTAKAMAKAIRKKTYKPSKTVKGIRR
jgi:hypothetical protein